MSIKNEIDRIKQSKAEIISALKNKGVTVPSDASIDDLSALVEAIEVGGNGDYNIVATIDGENQSLAITDAEGSNGITPTGTINITENGTYDVTNYASANVNVSNSGETPEYTRVGYIQFTGDQTIDTGIVCTQDTKIRALFTREETNQNYFYGVSSSDNTASVTAYMGGTWRFGDKTASKGNYVIANNDIIYTSIVDNTQIHIPNSNTALSGVNDFETVGSLTIGSCRNNNGTLGTPQFVGKLYLFEMWEGAEQVLKLIPMVNREGVYGFWDEISETFLISITDTPLEGEV